jgi:AraC-like DNA-binding protein
MKITRNHLDIFIDYAVLCGVSKEQLAERLKCYVDIKATPTKIGSEIFIRCMEVVTTLLNNQLSGIRVGKHLDMHTLGVIYDISLKASTIEEGLHYCHDYLKHTFPQLQVTNTLVGDTVEITIAVEGFPENISTIVLETILTVMGKELIMMFGSTEITYTSRFCDEQYPRDWEKHKFFSLRFSKKVLKASVRNLVNEGIDIVIPKYLEMLEHLKNENTFTSRVKMAILNLAAPSLPSIELVAEVYNYTVRTFQRKLASEAVIFRDILEELKREIGTLLIRHERFQIADIAAILGYAESSSLIRSFKKWHGKSPQQYRQSLAQQQGLQPFQQ